MSERLKLDLTDKKKWETSSPDSLAEYFGYEPDKNFIAALNQFMNQVVKPAEVTLYLSTVAQGFFRQWQPPLTPSHRK